MTGQNNFFKLNFSIVSEIFYIFFSTMPGIYINGRSSIHNFSLEIGDFGTSIVTNSGLSVTAESYNSTIAISTHTSTLHSDSSVCGIVTLIVFFCFALVIMIALAIFLAKRRQNPITEWNHGSKLSF